jgi:chromosome segregation ATPase
MPDDPLVPRGSDPHDSGMEARVQKLEDIVTDIRTELADIRTELKSMRQDLTKLMIDLARVDRRVSQMPTLIQLVTVVIAIWGMAFATPRFAGH